VHIKAPTPDENQTAELEALDIVEIQLDVPLATKTKLLIFED